MLIRLTVLLATHLAHVSEVHTTMEGFVVDGIDVNIEDFPHSVFLAIECLRESPEQFACGGSIITQNFVLSAGHCFEGCHPTKTIIVACVGSTENVAGATGLVTDFKIHEQYESKGLHNDISLLKLGSPLKLGGTVQKVYLMKNPPTDDIAEIAGWGLVDENRGMESLTLKEAIQKVMTREECVKILGFLPKNAFCANSLGGYAAEGDSGSALVLQRFVQIGIVSYKDMKISASLVAYTNVSAYYDWIKTNIQEMSCR